MENQINNFLNRKCMIDNKISTQVGMYLKQYALVLATAESCTAGLIAATIAETSGSSQWLDAGFVVYSAEAKEKSLGVSLNTISKYNITSCEVAKEMSLGAIQKSRANVAIAVTGVAGPSGGTLEIPVGTICMSWAFLINTEIKSFEETKVFSGSRNEVREAIVEYTLKKLMEIHSSMI
jgi:nicotinamide-nucleotide amidase